MPRQREPLHEQRKFVEDREDLSGYGVVVVMRGGTQIACGQRRIASRVGIAECTPNCRTS
jgi:hypothetical protein